MGYYLNHTINNNGETLPLFAQDKLKQIFDNQRGSVLVLKPLKLSDIPEDMALICICENQQFDAAALCYSQEEMEAFSSPSDMRVKHWLTIPKADAWALTGYVP